MAGNFDGIKRQKFGVEIECTGLTREMAAKAVLRLFNSDYSHEGGTYDIFSVKDPQSRKWNFVYDSSIKRFDEERTETSSKNYAVEIVTPILEYKDIGQLQEVVRYVKKRI